jgi:hypothetical protein
MCRCNICGPVSRNEADFDVSIGREDRLLRVCRWCSQDLTLFGVRLNQVVKLPWHALEKHRILRIVNRVNRNISEAFGRTMIEKRGKKWAFTDFGVEIWGKTEEDQEEFAVGIKRNLPGELE